MGCIVVQPTSILEQNIMTVKIIKIEQRSRVGCIVMQPTSTLEQNIMTVKIVTN